MQQKQMMIETWVRYTHLEKLYGYLPGMDEGLLARLFGLDPEAYRAIKSRFDTNAHDAAGELLDDASFAGRFVPDVVSLQLDWVICLLGGNDATRIGPEPNKPQVGLEETARNFEAMRRIVSGQTAAEWVWITPPTYDEERAASFPPFKMGQSVFLNDDVIAIGDYIREQKEPVVDIQAVLGTPADLGLQGPDGVHPSLAGQKAIARAFVGRLTESSGGGVEKS